MFSNVVTGACQPVTRAVATGDRAKDRRGRRRDSRQRRNPGSLRSWLGVYDDVGDLGYVLTEDLFEFAGDLVRLREGLV